MHPRGWGHRLWGQGPTGLGSPTDFGQVTFLWASTSSSGKWVYQQDLACRENSVNSTVCTFISNSYISPRKAGTSDIPT